MHAPLSSDLLRLAVAVVRFLPGALDEFASRAGSAPLDRACREVLLQSHLFCGFPRTIAALDHLSAAGVDLSPSPAPEAAPGDPEKGAALFDRIYGERAAEVREHLANLDPDLAEVVAAHAYGTVLSRGGLDARARELLAVVMLSATGHARQLASHARGAIRCGATPGEVTQALDAVTDLVSPEDMARAREVVARFTYQD